MKKLIVIILLLVFALNAEAQYRSRRHVRPVAYYPQNPQIIITVNANASNRACHTHRRPIYEYRDVWNSRCRRYERVQILVRWDTYTCNDRRCNRY